MDKKSFSILLVSTIAAAFIGSFAATMVVNYRPAIPPIPPHLEIEHVNAQMQPGMDESIRFMQEQQAAFERFDDDFEDNLSKMPHPKFGYFSNSGLKTQETKDAYIFTVDLKPFNNDFKNVDIKVNGRKVLISAKYSAKGKKDFNSTQFSQVLILPVKIKSEDIKQEQKSNFLVITIPKKSD